MDQSHWNRRKNGVLDVCVVLLGCVSKADVVLEKKETVFAFYGSLGRVQLVEEPVVQKLFSCLDED